MDTEQKQSVAAIRARYLTGEQMPSPSEIVLLFEELDWLTRHNKALDTENKRLTEALSEMQHNFLAAESEMHDWQDQVTRLKQDLELAQLRLQSNQAI